MAGFESKTFVQASTPPAAATLLKPLRGLFAASLIARANPLTMGGGRVAEISGIDGSGTAGTHLA